MSKIRGRGNLSTELALLRLLRGERISGWRRHVKIAGVPDFAFPERRVAVFVDGCFWHGCGRCKRKVPSTNRVFWSDKIASNRARDRAVRQRLRHSGWIVVAIWEHEFGRPDRIAGRLRAALRLAAIPSTR